MNAPAFDFNRCLTTGRVVDLNGQFIVETPAAPFMKRLHEVPNLKDKQILAACALRHDPGCIEANLFCADFAKDGQACLEFLFSAVIGGDAIWQPIIEAHGGELDWNSTPDMRRYVIALGALGEELDHQGRHEEARHYLQRAQLLYDDPTVSFNLVQMNLGTGLSY